MTRILQGTITSNRMQKTVVVRVDRLRKHAKYQKYHRASKTFKAHAADAGAYQIGDVVEIEETRPLSRDKRWRVVALVRRIESESDEAPAETNP